MSEGSDLTTKRLDAQEIAEQAVAHAKTALPVEPPPARWKLPASIAAAFFAISLVLSQIVTLQDRADDDARLKEQSEQLALLRRQSEEELRNQDFIISLAADVKSLLDQQNADAANREPRINDAIKRIIDGIAAGNADTAAALEEIRSLSRQNRASLAKLDALIAEAERERSDDRRQRQGFAGGHGHAMSINPTPPPSQPPERPCRGLLDPVLGCG